VLSCLLRLCLSRKDHFNPVTWAWSEALNLQASYSLDVIQAFLQPCLDYNVVCLLSLYPAYINNDYPLILEWLGLYSLPSLYYCLRLLRLSYRCPYYLTVAWYLALLFQ
jgi:hypothetical protein